MSVSLLCHPETYCATIENISVLVTKSDDNSLTLKYMIAGDIDGLLLPHHEQASREDDLWQESCMELFLQPQDAQFYYEFNFSPSSQWAVYRFDSYRSGRTSPPISHDPVIRTHHETDLFTLLVDLDLNDFPELAGNDPLSAGLSAVVEEVSGRKSFWALQHVGEKPDFHNSDCFTHQLGAAHRS